MPKPISRKTRLGRLRAIAGASAEEFAEIGCVSVHTIRSVETGRLKLSDGVAESIAFGTGVEPEWLLGLGRAERPTALDVTRGERVAYTRAHYKARRQKKPFGPLLPLLGDIYRVRCLQLLGFFRAAEREGRAAPALYLFGRFLKEAAEAFIQDSADRARFQELVQAEFQAAVGEQRRRKASEEQAHRHMLDLMAEGAPRRRSGRSGR